MEKYENKTWKRFGWFAIAASMLIGVHCLENKSPELFAKGNQMFQDNTPAYIAPNGVIYSKQDLKEQVEYFSQVAQERKQKQQEARTEEMESFNLKATLRMAELVMMQARSDNGADELEVIEGVQDIVNETYRRFPELTKEISKEKLFEELYMTVIKKSKELNLYGE